MRIHILQHVSFESPGTLLDWAARRQYPVTFTRLYEPPVVFPAVEDLDLVVVMGGPMGVYEEDRWPWMEREKEWIRTCVDAGRRVLGICLGAQLLAEILGARVYPHTQPEIGFFPVHATVANDPLWAGLPDPWTVLHWHGDTFDLPSGATLLASSAACPNQAFRKGSCLGIQFHPEAHTALVEALLQHEGPGLVPGDNVQSVDMIRALANKALPEPEDFFALLDRFVDKE
ncbi:MAG TPA: type 1 glutamine amidotransferase [Chitinophagaceae bacterium]|jgi:GMP synthase-like glutamine amidotransferase|nr:type 1 glutamine amidotransferase [Chitinophagaceae bacterium]